MYFFFKWFELIVKLITIGKHLMIKAGVTVRGVLDLGLIKDSKMKLRM